jgi:hypothetical protein
MAAVSGDRCGTGTGTRPNNRHNQRREHVIYASPQVSGKTLDFVVGKVDDVQRLNTDRAAGAEVADNIKTFAENLDATMLFAGISLETAPLFSGENGEQWRKRTRPINLSNYSLSDEADHKEWVQLVASFESILPLPLHAHGMLERHAGYLYHRMEAQSHPGLAPA